MKNWENKHFHGEPKIPKQKRIKSKIKSKPIQQKNSIKSNVSFPNQKKKKEQKEGKCNRAGSDDLMVADM